MRLKIKLLLIMIFCCQQVFAQPGGGTNSDESVEQYEVARFLGGWGNTGDIHVNSSLQASISPSSFAHSNGTIVNIPFPNGVTPSNYFIYIEGISEKGNVALTLSNNNSSQPDRVGIYNSSLGVSFLADPFHGLPPAGFIKHFALGISEKDELLGRSSDIGSLPDIYWLREPIGTTHIISSPSGCNFDYAISINTQGQVLGVCTSPAGLRGFVWTINAGPQLLPTMGLPGENFLPRGIDRSGTVYGELSYLDPLTAPVQLTIAVRVGITLPMSELPNSRVPSVIYPWNEGISIRAISSDGSRILGERYTSLGGEDVVYFNNYLAPSLYDVSQLAREISAPTGVNVKFHPTSISNSIIGGKFADWNQGVFQGAILKRVHRFN